MGFRIFIIVPLLLISLKARTVWYAQVDTTGKTINACIDFKYSIDDAIVDLNKKFRSCNLLTQPGYLYFGFQLDCGPDNNHFFFRTEKDCLAFAHHLKIEAPKGIDADIKAFAPDGILHRGRWAVIYGSCLSKSLTKEKIKNKLVRLYVDVCLCYAKWTDSYAEDSDIPQNVDQVKSVVSVCVEKSK